MMKKFFPAFIFLLTAFISSCNNKQPFKPDYSNIGGTVIGEENCYTDSSEDYWLLDFSFYPDSPHIGDTLILNGVTYTNVLKVKGLDPRLKKIGMNVSIDYKTVTPNIVVSSDCNVVNPVTYPLKELFIINQFEIR